MANEFKHGNVGTDLSQNEWEGVGTHVFDGQATGDIPYASSNSQISRLPIGSNNQVLTASAGVPGWANAAGGGGALLGFQVLTATSNQTYTKNASANNIMVELVGGGGGGGGANSGANQSSAGGGGGGGAFTRRFIANAAGTYPYQCGAGGAGGTAGGAGSNGSTTYFANGTENLNAPGGVRGSANARANAFTGSLGGAGGTAGTGNGSVGGDLFLIGTAGQMGWVSNRALSGGGAGGPAGGYLAGGGAPGNNTAGGAAGNYGGGGGGGSAFQNVANLAGGNGGNGVIIVWEYT
jgi:hypothetical protein